jgi:hypothetical protein
VKRPRLAKHIERGRGRGLDGPRKLDPMPLGRGNTLVVLSRSRVVAAESDCMNCKPQINFVVSWSRLGVCFLSVTGTYRYRVFPMSHYKFSLPRIKGPTTLQYHTARVCFLRVTTSILFPQIEGPHHSPFFYIYHPSLQCLSTTNRDGFQEWR